MTGVEGLIIRIRPYGRWILLMLAFMFAVEVSHYAAQSLVRVVVSQFRARLVPIYRVQVPDKVVSISFDAVWGVEYTDELLDILRQHNIKTTFFLGGYWIERYPDYVCKIVAAGHEIGNHTYSHPHLNRLSPEKIREELVKNHDLIKEVCGFEAVLFRPPFGEYSDKVIKVASDLGYKTIQWSIDSLDWKDISAEAMVDRILAQISPGDIVLFHNNGKHTAAAIRILIPRLQSMGYRIVPISELVYEDDYHIEEHSGTQVPRRPRKGPDAR